MGLYCDQSTGACYGRRKHNGEVVLEKPIPRQKAEVIFEQYARHGKLPKRSPPLSMEGRKLRWRLSYGSFTTSGEIALEGTEPVDDRVRVLEAEVSALTGRAP